VTRAPPGPVACTVLSEGTLTTGGVVSTTVTANEALPVFPERSVALQVTVVAPPGNVDPEGQEPQSTGRGPSTSSTAEAE